MSYCIHGVCFLCCKWPYSDVGLLRYHVKSMVTDDDEIDKLTQWKTVSKQYCWGFHPNTPELLTLKKRVVL